MTPDERQLLSSLFERVKGAANAPRDPQAESFITERVREQPYAPYLFAQTVIVQEEALKAAASRIQELEGELAEAKKAHEAGSTSFLGGLGKSVFGTQASPAAEPTGRTGSGVPAFAPREAPRGEVPRGPWGAPAPQPAMGAPGPAPGQAFGAAPQGGGFLRSAMATAAGVAGGALLFQGISSLFNGPHGQGSFLAGQGGTDAGSALAGTPASDASSIGSDIFGKPNEAAGAQSPISNAAHTQDDPPLDDPSLDDPNFDDPGFDDASFDDAGFDDAGDGGDWA